MTLHLSPEFGQILLATAQQLGCPKPLSRRTIG